MHPALPFADKLLLIASVALLLIEVVIVFALWDVRRLARKRDGWFMASLLFNVSLGILLAQVFSVLVAADLQIDRTSVDTHASLRFISELIVAITLLFAFQRLRSLRDPVVDRASPAVVERDAQGTGEIPLAGGDIRSVVDHRDRDNDPIPSEAD
jgi:magnesium-transporting ATPase (P-type)